MSVFLPYSTSYSECVSFYTFFSHLSIIQVLRINFSFCTFFCVYCYFPGNTVFVSHFPRMTVLLTKSRFYSVYFSYFRLVTVSCYIPGPIFCVSFCLYFSVSCNISSPTMWVSHLLRLPLFSPYSRSYNVSLSVSLLIIFLTVFQVLQWAFLIFHVFQCFSPYSRS